MRKLGKIFGKNKNENVNGMPDMHEVTLSKNFPHADLVPVEYKHTVKFYEDGADPLAYERDRLKGLPADWLMKDKRIPAIRADSQMEIEIGKRQHTNHTYTEQTIIDLQNGDIAHADELLARLDEEYNSYEAEEQRLRALMK